ncbi:DUF2207 domain-containing protein [Georgenia faecalis]|uniref:DUF2207 domain-containing protein n=1 Tax=Georgenia faecalis TaxID=2483799 RepID=A0ABV9D6F8_9MICO|nr:DUF2207 domain-containing protein [Georgenia faecalis]
MPAVVARRRSPRSAHALVALLAACALVLLPVLLGPGALPAARADSSDDWSVTRYDLHGELAEDGTMDVVLDLDFDFADDPGHGPYIAIPELQEIPGDPDRYRAFEVTDVAATSPSGAPAQVATETESGTLLVRVGDEDVEVEGVQSYRITYRISGLVNPDVDGADELYWNVIGPAWEVPLEDVGVTVEGPADVQEVRCFAGGAGSTDACADASSDAATATFRQRGLDAGEQLTVLATWPVGTFDAAPAYAPRRTWDNTMGITPVTGSVAGVATLAGGAAVVWVARRRGRDEAALDRAATGAGGAAAPVRPTPPDGVRPGEVGTLTDERADPRDLSATIIDLGVRGYLRVEEVDDDAARPRKGGGQAGEAASWRLVRLTPAPGDRLARYEEVLLAELFGGKTEVRLADLSGFHKARAAVQGALYEAVVEAGWFRSDPSAARRRWGLVGLLVLLVGAAAAVVLVLTGHGVLGIPLLVIGALVLAVSSMAPVRTARGTAVLAETLAFKRYLASVDAHALRIERGEDLFSRYLPYAVVFGLADRWAGLFAQREAEGAPVTAPSWYLPAAGVALWGSPGSASSAVGAFAAAAASAATPGAGGGSGTTGFAGGGVGGGGGGGW